MEDANLKIVRAVEARVEQKVSINAREIKRNINLARAYPYSYIRFNVIGLSIGLYTTSNTKFVSID